MDRIKTSAALGIFDGVHTGHRAVIANAAKHRIDGAEPCVFTFSPDTALFKGADGFIYGECEKNQIIGKSCGVEKIYSESFADICSLDGESFVKEILCGKLNVAYVSCGRDFRFGKGASCGAEELAQFGKKYGFETETADDVCVSGERVSSTLIRRLVKDGEMEKAAEYLGEPYAIFKKVTHGAQLGRTIGYPTANQVFEKGQLVPRFGVYASKVYIDGKCFSAMTNVGIKPTVDYDGMPLAETYIDGFNGDIYEKNIHTALIRFIRPEMKFSSLGELKNQIAEDIRCAVKLI